MGTIQVAYGTPTRYEITIYRATITKRGSDLDWTVLNLCDEALGLGGINLATCPRASLSAPPRPFRFRKSPSLTIPPKRTSSDSRTIFSLSRTRIDMARLDSRKNVEQSDIPSGVPRVDA